MQTQIIRKEPGFKELKSTLFQIKHDLKRIIQEQEKAEQERQKRPNLEVATIEH